MEEAKGRSKFAINPLRMKQLKSLFLLAFSLCLCYHAQSQTNTFPGNGNAGVGTTNPGEKLEVVGNLKVKGDLIVTDTAKFKGDVRIDGLLKLKYFSNNSLTNDRLLGVNPNGKVIVDPNILHLNTYRISPLLGDSLIRFGDSTMIFNPTFNRIDANQSGTIKGIGLSFGKAQGEYAVALGPCGAPGKNAIAAGYFVSAFAQNSVCIGAGPVGSPNSLVNNTPYSFMVGFNSNVPTLFVSTATGSGTTGAVGIATTYIPSGYKLAVEGKIIAEELVVKLRADWPDYVFASDYKPMSIQERKQFTRSNNHLPWMLSAPEIMKSGVGVGAVLTGITKNVEEHELLIYQLLERIEKLEKENESMKTLLKK